jgi:hypothetical protein
MLGGLLWIAGAVITALRPEGCIAGECELPGRSMREGNFFDGALSVATVLFIALGVAALVIRARSAGRFGRLGSVGVLASLVGAALLFSALLIQAILFGGDFPYMPLFVLTGGLPLILGMLLLGIAILRAAVLPAWAVVLLIIGTLALLGFNDQNARALMAVPFGIAWLAVGYTLWSGKGEQPQET